jgi:hypothetical protein
MNMPPSHGPLTTIRNWLWLWRVHRRPLFTRYLFAEIDLETYGWHEIAVTGRQPAVALSHRYAK